jgi:hypothetical protein
LSGWRSRNLCNRGSKLTSPEVPTDLSKLKTTDLLKKVVSFDTPLSEKTEAIKQLGGKALKAIYTKLRRW